MNLDPPSPQNGIDVFVSYSHRDREWVRELVDRLAGEKIGNRFLTVAIDELAFVPGSSLVGSIEQGIRKSKRLVCVLSPDFVASDWTALEYQMKMLDDPAGRKGLIIPILYRDCNVPYSLRIRLAADFRKEENGDRAYQRLLLALGVAKTARDSYGLGNEIPTRQDSQGFIGSYEADPINEVLALNAFEVVKTPDSIWSSETSCKTLLEVLDTMKGHHSIAFTLRSGKLWSLYPLDRKASPFWDSIDGRTITKTAVSEMLATSDARNLALELMNKSLTFHLRNLGLVYDKRYGRYYFPPRFGKDRTVEWPGLQRRATRRVTVPIFRNDEVTCYRHLAARMRFCMISSRLTLEILPARTLTTDGYAPMRGPGVGAAVQGLSRRVFNNAFWLDVLFWLHQLYDNGKVRIPTGGAEIEVSTTPLTVTVGGGIAGDSLAILTREYLDRWAQEIGSADEVAELPEDFGERETEEELQ